MKMDGTLVNPKKLQPSSEWRFHRDIFASRKDVNAVVHTHSVYASALSVLGAAIPQFHYMIAVSGGKDSAVLLETLHHFLKNRKDVKLIAGCVNEGIEGYRKPSMECAEKLANSLDIEFITLSYKSLGFDLSLIHI